MEIQPPKRDTQRDRRNSFVSGDYGVTFQEEKMISRKGAKVRKDANIRKDNLIFAPWRFSAALREISSKGAKVRED